MTVWCAICCRSITDESATVQTKADCRHYYHDSCVKVRLSLPNKSHAAGRIANTCPVCIPNISDILKQINARLDSVDKIGEMSKKLEKIDVNKINEMSKKLEKIDAKKINEISSKLKKIDQIGDISVKVDGMVSKVDGFKKSIASIEGKMDKLSLDYNLLKTTVKELEERVATVERVQLGVPADLAEEIKCAAQKVCDGSLELRTLQLESQFLADEITVAGIPEERGEKLMEKVMLFYTTLGVKVTENNIVKLERLGRAGAANRNVRVKFANQRYVDDIMRSVKSNPVKLGAIMSAVQDPDVLIYVHRQHPPSLYKLRSDVRDKAPVKLLPSTGVGPLRGLLD
uniref:RING-type domain-containing protein n=1 Tax=Cotesia congregata TaxID=51543 RepID=S6D9M7_COTCN|nr:hypothetical protein CcPL6.021 [Cotesia congregata]